MPTRFAALVTLACCLVACDHPYRLNNQFVASVDSAVAKVGLRSVSPSTCVPGTLTKVTVYWDNPREIEVSATVTSADEDLTGAPSIDASTPGRLDFHFTPTDSAAGLPVSFSVVAVTQDRRPLVDQTIRLTCQAVGTATHTIVYEANGGSGSITTSGAAYAEGATVVVESGSGLTRSGYLFSTWNTKADGTGTSYASGANLTLGADTTLYAQWVEAVTLTYDANGGTGTLPADSGRAYPKGTTVTLGSPSTLNRSGYLFTSWNTRTDSNGDDRDPGDPYVLTQNVVFYALWVPSSTVTWNQNGGTGLTTATTPIATNSTMAIPNPTGMTYPGHTFTGWNTAIDGTGVAHIVGTTMTVSGDVTLYAQWQNDSLAAALKDLGAGTPLSGSLTSEEWTELGTAVRAATAGLDLDLSAVDATTFPAALFQDCAALSSVVLPHSLVTLPDQSFDGCANLTSLTLDSSLQSIGTGAIKDCTNLTKLTIPASVVVLGGGCFQNSGVAGDGGELTFLRSATSGYYEGGDFSQDCYFGTSTMDIFGYDANSGNPNTFAIVVPSASAELEYEALPLMSRYTSNIQSPKSTGVS